MEGTIINRPMSPDRIRYLYVLTNGEKKTIFGTIS